MSTFVLIPGAWLGAWVWQPVAEHLRALGHIVHTLTLSGLSSPATSAAPSLGSPSTASPTASAATSFTAPANPSDTADPPSPATSSLTGVGLATHVSDVLGLLESVDARDAVLVGHSYAGIVAGQVAGLMPTRVAHTVFVDANLPVDGQSMTDGWSARGQRLVRATVAANGGWWPVPELEEFDGHDLADEQVAWLVAHAAPHPGRTLFEPAHLARPLARLSATYVTCLRPDPKPRDEVLALHGQPTWSFIDLDTGHWPMLSAPTALTTLLTAAATTSSTAKSTSRASTSTTPAPAPTDP